MCRVIYADWVGCVTPKVKGQLCGVTIEALPLREGSRQIVRRTAKESANHTGVFTYTLDGAYHRIEMIFDTR